MKFRIILLWLIIILCSFGLGFFIFNFFVIPKLIGGGKNISVPNLVGKRLIDAQKIVIDQGFQLGDTRAVYDTIYPTGFVVSQKPLAGSIVKTGKKINFIVSKGEQIAVVPSLEQMTLDQGLRILNSIGFNPTVESLRSTIPYGKIIGSEPPVGSQLSTRRRLKLYISTGNYGIFFMPMVIGLPIAAAIDTINNNGLILGEIKTIPSDEPTGLVIIQYPEDGMKVKTGDTVRLIVSGKK